MTDYVVSTAYTLDDQVTASAGAMAASVDSLGASVEITETKVTRAGKSATAYANQNDAVTAATQRLASALRDQSAGQDTLADGVARGTVAADAAARANDGLAAKVDLARAKLAAAQVAAAGLQEAQAELNTSTAAGTVVAGQITDAHTNASFATAGLTREFLVLGHEVVTGNYSRIPGSLIVLAERSNILHTAIEAVGGIVTSTGGQFAIFGVVAAAGLAVAAYSAESANLQLINLQNTLRATRDDYAALAPVIVAAGKASAAALGISGSDAESAAKTIGGAAGFTGSQSSLDGLIATARDLSVVLGETVPEAAKVLAAALNDPAAEADKLSKESFPGFNVQLATAVKNMEDSGDRAGAFSIVLKTLQADVSGVANNVTPLEAALHNLGKAFNDPVAGGESLGKTLGNTVVTAAAVAVQSLTGLVQIVNDLRSLGSSDTQAGAAAAASSAYGPVAPTAVVRAAPTGYMSAINPLIDQIAEAKGYAAQVADMATRVAQAESGGNQFGGYLGTGANGTAGQITTSSVGAQGVMQIMPATSKGMAGDPATTAGNVSDGLDIINRLMTKYNNDPVLVAMAYNWGEGNVDLFRAGKASIPNETADFVQKVTGTTPDQLANKFAGAYSASPGTSASPTGNADANMAAGYAASANTLAVRQQANADQQKLLQGDIATASAAGDTDAVTRLSQALADAKGKATDMITEQQKLARSALDATAPLQAQDGATRDMATIQQRFAEVARASGQDIDQTALLTAQTAKLRELQQAHDDALGAIERDTAGVLAMIPVYQQGATAVDDAKNTLTAETDARKTAITNTTAYNAQVAETVQALHNKSAALADVSTAQLATGQQDQLALLQAETAGVGTNTDALNKQLAVLKEKQRIENLPGGDLDSAASKQSLANVAAIQDATAALNEQKAAMSELSSFGVNTFDKIGTAITQAFSTGSIKALNFGSIVDGVLSEIVQEVLKLAVLNPVINSLFGTNNVTASSVGGALGSLLGNSGSGTSGSVVSANGSWDNLQQRDIVSGTPSTSSSLTTDAGLLGTAYKAADWLFPDTVKEATAFFSSAKDAITGAVNGLGESVGIGTANAAAGVAGGVSAAGQTVSTAAADDVATASATGAAASQIADALPFIGAGIGVISNLIQGNVTGAALVGGGAAIGTAIAPGIGTAIGAALGEVASLFGIGGHPKNAYQATAIDASGGGLSVGDTVSQLDDPSSAIASTTKWVNGLNAYMSALHLAVTNSDGRVGSVGQGVTGLSQSTSPEGILPALRFTSTETNDNLGKTEAADLPWHQFDTADALQAQITADAQFAARLDSLGLTLQSVAVGFKNISIASVAGDSSDTATALQHDLPGQTFADESALEAEITKVYNFVNGTMVALSNPQLTTALSATQQAVNAVISQYQAAEAQAQSYGLSITGLSAAMNTAIDETTASARLALGQTYNGILAADMAAKGDQEGADLLNFDQQAAQQRAAFSQQITDIYGVGFEAMSGYATLMAGEDQSLADQRLAIQKKYSDATLANDNAAAGTVATNVTNLTTYLTGLRTSTLSPLSAQDQATAAAAQFDQQASLAAGGNATALAGLSGYADTALTTDKAVYGSGAQYVQFFQQVLDSLSAATSAPSDVLTASALAATSQAQTVTLVASLEAVRAEIAALRAEVQQGSAMPARIAA